MRTPTAIALTAAFFGCRGSPLQLDELSVEASAAIGTVVLVSWTYQGGGQARVEYSYEGGEVKGVSATSQGDSYSAMVLGLKPLTEYEFKVAIGQGEERLESDPISLVTGSATASLHNLYTETYSESEHFDGYLALGLLGTESAAVMTDRDGDLVWWYEHEDGDNIYISRVLPDHEGTSIYVNPIDSENYGETELPFLSISLDGMQVEEIPVDQLQHHDFAKTADGRWGYVAFDPYTSAYGETTDGDMLVTMDSDGSQTVIWSSWDDYPLPKNPSLKDIENSVVHANSLDHDTTSGLWYVSLRDKNCILAIDESTQQRVWQLGGALDSDFQLLSGDFTTYQHGFEFIGDQLTVFDNNSSPIEGSRVVRYEVDYAHFTYEQLWEYAPGNHHEEALGDVRTLPNGNLLVTWSMSGLIEEFNPDMELVWQMWTGAGMGFSYTTYVDDIYDLGPVGTN